MVKELIKQETVKFQDFFEMIKEGGKYECFTPDGWVEIGDVYLKKNKRKHNLLFETGITIITSEDHLFEIETENLTEEDILSRIELLDNGLWIRSRNVKRGDRLVSKKGIQTVKSNDFNSIGDTYDLEILSERHRYWSGDLSSHNTGKSAIAEGLALRIVQRKVSRVLFNKRVVMLDIASMVAGTKYRGQFEERIKALMNELENNTDVILFIDEIHTIVGAGGASGSLDASNMFKPALARGEIQIIGATTLDEYRKHIEKDGALERRFQKVIVEPATEDETIQIINNIKDKYEAHHNVEYTEGAVLACVKLTSRYLTDRFLPDKAIDALDEAGARVHISNIVVPKEITDIEEKIQDVLTQKTLVVRSQRFEEAAKLRDTEKQLISNLDEARKKWEEDQKNNRQKVTEDNVADVVSMMTGIPLQRINEKENDKLSTMYESINDKVIGQNDAVKKVVKSIQRSRIGLKDPNKPIGTFLFMGPTGVGKCFTKKTFISIRNKKTGKVENIDIENLIYKLNQHQLD